ncbi:MAG: PD-(D/E)XK nuclease family protein [Candidatus Azobacteroides sp.]|nr:PD-(D/E)XK nuclease family protein [Candidatus Azobacteroides sp.]
MKPFLYRVAELFLTHYREELTDIHFVFPNRRAGIFFQKYLAEIARQPLFSPEILTINDLFIELSDMQLADNIGLLFEIYDVYKTVSQATETFDEFVYWGEMLLSDFDDVDKYLADPKQLFCNVTDIKEIESRFNFLTEEQVAAIRRFWGNFIPVGENPQKKDFMYIWEILYPMYVELNQRLEQKGIGYEGMIYRKVAEKVKRKEDIQWPFSHIVFIGFNALCKAEKVLLNHLKNTEIADFYWDYDADWVRDPENKASFFITDNFNRFPSKHTLYNHADLFDNRPEFELIGIPSGVGQAKEMYNILKRLYADKSIHESTSALNTAVILPDENMLLPVLHSIPEEISRINVTMGYPLCDTPVDGLMQHIVEMQRNVRLQGGQPVFYYKYVLPVLNHRYITFFAPEEARRFVLDIQRHNRFVIRKEHIPAHPVLEMIFRIPSNPYAASDYLLDLLLYFQQVIPDPDEDEEVPLRLTQVEKEFIYRYYITVNRMKELLSEKINAEMSIDAYFRLLKKLVGTVSIPFVGEPLSGLQVMGTLEARALNFDNIIILSMNEGVYPKREAKHSFIPYNLRQGFELPNMEHQDCIFTYHFYRMISCSKRVFMLYDTRSDGLQTGEVSRFVYQLKYHYQVPIKEKLLTFDVKLNGMTSIILQKNEHIAGQLSRFLDGGDKALSASAVNTYINCPFKFYLANVESLSEEDDVTETIEASTFGSIFHQVMQDIYEPLANRIIQADILVKIKNDDDFLTALIEKAFGKYFHRSNKREKLTGQNFLVSEIIRKYVKKMLDIDRKHTPFTYLESEMLIRTSLTLPSGKKVQLKGFIDRIDQVNGVIRILDYKTGMGVQTYKNIPHLFEKETDKRPKDLMQVFMYCLLYEEIKKTGLPIEPGIYYLRNLFANQFDTRIIQKDTAATVIEDFAACKEEFKDHFYACLEEIFSPEIPFTQTTVIKYCEYCSFSEICGR